MTLLDDVIEQASDGDASAMLRKLMIVAHRLGADSLLAWVKSELNGYDDVNEVPDYRGPFVVNVQAVITGPGPSKGTSTLTKLGIPEGFDALFELRFKDPVAALEGFATSEDGIAVPWDPAIIGLYNGWIDDGLVPFIEYWGVYSAQKVFPQGALRGIIDVVRTKALQLALDLQAEFPDAGEKDGPTVNNPAVAATVTNIVNNIYGPVTGLAQGHIVKQKVTVAVGDLDGAIENARRFLGADGLAQLSVVLEADGSDDDKRGRLERFVDAVKAGSVALATGVTTDVAANALTEIAMQFFGW